MNNELRIDKVLDFCDEPQLFVARDKFDAQFLCLLFDDSNVLTYTAIRISNERLSNFLEGKSDLRHLFTHPEMKGEYYNVVYDGSRLVISPLDCTKLPEERLPQDGYVLDSDSQEAVTVHLPIKDHRLFTEIVRKFGWVCM